MTTLNQIAKSLKVNAKTARRKLRTSANVPALENNTRWAWSKASDIAKVKQIIKA